MTKKEDGALRVSGGRGMLPQILCSTAIALVLAFAPEPASAQARQGGASGQPPSAQVQQRSFHIPAQPLASALTAFGDQAGMQVAVDTAILAGRTSQPVSGRMAPEEALRRLLAGSGIAWRFADPTTLVLHRVSSSGDGTIMLDPVTVQGWGTRESAYGPVQGFVATRSATGTKADIPLIETPQSISIVTADQVSIQNAESLSQALKYTPGVNALDGDTMTNDGMVIRGFNVTGAALTYLNGTRYSRNIYSGVSEPYALERIEVLKGPASVLYGNAAPGGIINMVTKQPQTESFRELSMQLGSFGRKQISGDFTGALTEGGELSYRVTGLVRRSDTMVDEIPDDRAFGQASIRWQPTDRTSLTFLAGYQDNEVGFHAGLPLQGTVLDNVNGKIARDRFVGEPAFNSFDVKNYSVGYLFSHQFNDHLTFRQNALYYDAETDWRYMSIGSLDASQRLLARFPSERHDRNSFWTIDNQLEAKWKLGNTEHTTLVGIDYTRNKFARTQYRGTVGSLDIFDPQYGAPVTMDKSKASIDFQDKDSQLGIYAQEHMKIADRLVVMLGGRYDKAEAKSTNYLNGQSGTTYDEGVFTGRAGLVYLFDNGIAPYASFSQSFQPTAGQDFGGQPYKPSEGEQYEVGVRYQPPGRNASVTASVYQLTQTNVFTADPVNSGFYVQEGEVRSRGFELEGRASLASNLNLIASYSYIDNVVTKSNSGTEGNRFAGVPKHMASLWADYQFTGSLRDLRIGAGIRYFGQSYNLANTVKVPDYTVVDAVVSYNITPDWSVSLNVNNLFDEEYVTCVNACYYGTERSVFVKTSYRW